MTMTMTIFNLPKDLIEEIFSRIPMKSMRAVRLTCKTLNTLSQTPSFTKLHIGKEAAATKEGETRMIVLMDYNLHLISVVFNGIDIDPFSEQKVKLGCLNDSDQVKISRIFNCKGLLLCILKDDSRFVVWNPYLGQTRWIEPRYSHFPYGCDRYSYALGYENKESCRSYKLLRFIDYYCCPLGSQFFWYEIYDFDSDLWTTLDVIPHWCKLVGNPGVSIKGNTYFCASKRNSEEDGNHGVVDHIICFDFTSQRFGPLLPLPFSAGDNDYVTLSCVREEKLAALLQHNEWNPYELDLWITTKIEAEKVSWSKFLRVETGFDISVPFISGSYFIDEEKKVIIGFDERTYYHRVNIIGEGYFRQVDVGKPACRNYSRDLCVYVPSLVQIKQLAGGERKQESELEKCRYDQNMSRLVAYEKQVKQDDDERTKQFLMSIQKEKTPDN